MLLAFVDRTNYVTHRFVYTNLSRVSFTNQRKVSKVHLEFTVEVVVPDESMFFD